MSISEPSKAQFWGIREEEYRVLFVIAYWFNGHPLKIRGEKRRIATHPDLPLEELFIGTQHDYEKHEQAHKRLLNNGLLQDEYVCRRLIDWGLTQQGLQAIRECLGPSSNKLRPHWANEIDDGPLFGDPQEGVTHRKGVEVAGNVFPYMPWAFNMDKRRAYGVEWYPEDSHGKACHDLHVDTNEYMINIGVEVITSSNNRNRLVEKWERFQQKDRVTFWVFDRRETACELWNELDKRQVFSLDGRFRNYENWSSKAINRKIWRSSQKYRDRPAEDIIQTVTGLLEGDKNTIQDLFEEYYSNK